jgi:mutator protein MutT
MTTDESTADAVRIGIAVVEHAGRYLVGTRGPGGVLADFAEFPGGKCDPGELPEACALRECLEETGLSVVPVALLEVVRHEYPHGRVELHFWRCRPEGEPADPGGTFRWVDAAELAGLPLPPANAGVVARLLGG